MVYLPPGMTHDQAIQELADLMKHANDSGGMTDDMEAAARYAIRLVVRKRDLAHQPST